jgi:hypothetical protein
MKYILLLALLCLVIFNSYIGSNIIVERFSSDNINIKINIILLGDSSFKNNAFVDSKDSIESLLKHKVERSNVFVFAKDGAKVKDIYNQINNIPFRLNGKNSIIFLSVGGNDILKKNSDVDKIFNNYEKLLNELKGKFNNTKLIIGNLYTPPKMKNIFINDRILYSKINLWNSRINQYIHIQNETSKNNNITLLDLNNILNEPSDFVADYEPSKLGGEKIVNSISYLIP